MEKTKYPAPNERISKYWNMYIEDVSSRKNFKIGHLEQLRVLCEVYLKNEKLSQDIDENGYSDHSDGRYGEKYTERVEVKIWKKTLEEIRQYSRILGLLLVKDMKTNKDEEVENDWQ